MAFAIETAFVGAGGSICEGVLRAFLHAEVYAFTVVDIDGCAGGVCQIKPVQFYGSLIGTGHIELSVAGIA